MSVNSIPMTFGQVWMWVTGPMWTIGPVHLALEDLTAHLGAAQAMVTLSDPCNLNRDCMILCLCLRIVK